MKFTDENVETYKTSDFTLITHFLVCGVKPVKSEKESRRVTVHFAREEALESIRKTSLDADYMVKLSDVLRANVVWKGILDGTE
jgi:hypothetical protein